MSKRWPGGIITKNQATPTGPYENGSAPGIWTLNQMSYWVKQALWPTAGNVNPDLFIENLFSTYLYTGTGAAQTITNGIDLSGKGGLVWIKNRTTTSGFTFNHFLFDTSRGPLNRLITNNTDSSQSTTGTLTSFNANGFSLGSDSGGNVNYGPGTNTYASWTFREQPKFFDVVTYRGNGAANQIISHNLNATVGFLLIKKTTDASQWAAYARLSDGNYALFNTASSGFNLTGSAASTSNLTSLGYISSTIFKPYELSSSHTGGENDFNGLNNDYVAYLFAHDAGGFGLSGTENVISCGSYTGNGSVLSINLGYEAQWVLIKPYTGTGAGAEGWVILDIMRGMAAAGSTHNDAPLFANSSTAESAINNIVGPNATGFTLERGDGSVNASNKSYIYIAIRRGPMQVPTIGTSVFSPLALNNSTGTVNTTGFALDAQFVGIRSGVSSNFGLADRLRGISSTSTDSAQRLITSSTAAEDTTTITRAWNNTGFSTTATYAGVSNIYWNFRRAPGFFDIVCYTGDDAANRVLNHNLTIAPELMIFKRRGPAGVSTSWLVYSAGMSSPNNDYLILDSNGAKGTVSGTWGTPTATTFTLGIPFTETNGAAQTYVAYLFATVAGVSKVGSYTGTGATLNINAGFTTGARFVMIKRTDSTGDWFVWDTARGMVAGTDPRLALNTAAAESNANWVYTASSGFQIVTTDASVNASGGSYIYLAIA